MAAAKNTKENALEDVALGAGTQQNLSNLYSLDIYVGDYGYKKLVRISIGFLYELA
jgi:hypothetical protein